MNPFSVGMAISTPEFGDEARTTLQQLPARVVFELSPIVFPVLLDRVEACRPDFLLLDASEFKDGAWKMIEQIRRSAAALRIVVLSGSSDPDRILAAMRAGVNEYLYPPLSDALRRAFERMSRETETRADGHGNGRIIGFLSVKGGCGATTLACHAAMEIQCRTGGKTLLVDLDLSSGLISFLLRRDNRYSVADAIRNVPRLDPDYWRALVSEWRPGLEVAVAPSDEFMTASHDAQELRNVLQFVRTQYAWTIADLGRGLGASAGNGLRDIDELVLVSTMDLAALHRAKVLLGLIRDAGLAKEHVHLVLNRVHGKNDISPAELERAIGAGVFATVPEDRQPLEEACAAGALLPREHPLCRRIGSIVGKLAGVAEEKQRRRFGLFR